jgi:type 1 glutamine amidotransferase
MADRMPSSTPVRVLVFSKTADYRHDSIPAGIASLQRLAQQTGRFAVTASEDAEAHFTTEGLGPFSVILFLSTSGNFLTDAQVAALKNFIRSGGGFVGIHCASFGLLDHEWYADLVGARFDFHPEPQMGVISLENQDHFACCAELWLGSRSSEEKKSLEWFDEWYNFHSNPREKAQVLMTVDETSYRGGSMGDDHPVVWCREFDGGRSFYTALGHFDEAFADERFMGQVLRGILWAACKDDEV